MTSPQDPYQPPVGGQAPAPAGYGSGYGPPPGYGAAPRGTNTMAILSLVFAFVFWPLGLVFGFVAKKQIKRTGEGGNGLATAGIEHGLLTS